jgi:hypothetical protein
LATDNLQGVTAVRRAPSLLYITQKTHFRYGLERPILTELQNFKVQTVSFCWKKRFIR